MKLLIAILPFYISVLLALSISRLNCPLFPREEETKTEEIAVATRQVIIPVWKLNKANGFIQYLFGEHKIWALNISSAADKYQKITQDMSVKLVRIKGDSSIYLLREILC